MALHSGYTLRDANKQIAEFALLCVRQFLIERQKITARTPARQRSFHLEGVGVAVEMSFVPGRTTTLHRTYRMIVGGDVTRRLRIFALMQIFLDSDPDPEEGRQPATEIPFEPDATFETFAARVAMF